MLQRGKSSYTDPANAQRYRIATLLIATAAFVVIGIGNALDPPEPGGVYEKEGAAGILLVIGQTLPLRWPMLALAIIMASFMGHTGRDHGVIWVVQFTAIISLFLAINRGDGRQPLFSLVLVYVGIFVSFGIFREVDKVGNVLVQMLLFGGLWVIGNLFRTRTVRPESTEHVLKAMEAEQDRLAKEAVQDERARIARDLPDIIGHTLNVIVVQAGAARTVFKSRPDQELESLNSIETTARQSLSDMERMLGILRPVESEREPTAHSQDWDRSTDLLSSSPTPVCRWT